MEDLNIEMDAVVGKIELLRRDLEVVGRVSRGLSELEGVFAQLVARMRDADRLEESRYLRSLKPTRAVLNFLHECGPQLPSDIAGALEGLIASKSRNKRRLILETIRQLERGNRLTREGRVVALATPESAPA